MSEKDTELLRFMRENPIIDEVSGYAERVMPVSPEARKPHTELVALRRLLAEREMKEGNHGKPQA